MQALLSFIRGAGLCMIAVGLAFSHSLISIGVGLLGVYGLLRFYIGEKEWGSRSVWLMSAVFICLYVLQAISWFYTADKSQWWVEMRVKLPFVFLLPAAVWVWWDASFSMRKVVHGFFHLALMGVGMATLWRFMLDPAWALEEIYRGRYVPMVGGISHIYYAGLVGMGLFFLWQLPLWGGRVLKAAIGLVYLIILHGLALRTGLAALYGTALVLVILWAIQRPRRWLWAAAIIGIGVVGLNFLICKLPPLRQRWENMRVDLKHYKPGIDITHTSLTRRLAAIEASWRVFRKNPWLGVGIADNQQAVAAEIPNLPYRWEKQFYILPHNQFIEYGIGLGLIGLGVFVLFWIVAFRERLGWGWIGWLVYWLILLQAEAFLERQVGVTAFLWGSGVLWVELKRRCCSFGA
ncbi:MAG: O-antigen ligase family protein [Bacteroidia bacterium]|nr:O-antigen ligase family protein [Bacteroidia bacterium]MDW8134481.1 O-antigen ligase family protein [Bacteroidia bacterium]